MKNLSIIIFLLVALFSCSEFLEEDLSAQLTPEGGGLGNESGLTSALVGVYGPLTKTWITGFGSAATHAIVMGSDDLTTHKASNKASLREFDQYKVSAQNERLPFIWSGSYKSIQGCNNIIANYETATGDESVINHIAGEAFFMRAYNYFWIVRLWGKAPLVLQTHVFDPEVLEIEASSEQDIYNQILSDLDMGISLMGNTKPQPGRASAGTAKAIKAKVYLHMAGWPLNQTDKYALATQTAGEVIQNQDDYNLGLMDNFIDLWPSATVNNDGNKEEVFALNFAGTEWFTFNTDLGSAARPSDEGAQWDDYFSELTFFNEFPDQLRKDITFQTELSDGTPWQQFSTGRPYYKKMQGDRFTHENVLSLTLERMAEIYFVYAEAKVMDSGNDQDASALEAVNKIVRRAHGLPLDTPDASVDYTSLTQDQIVQEKAWEFAGEYCRWFDLVRLQKVEEVVAKKDPDDLQPLGPITYYAPLPVSETLANENLKSGD